MLRGRTTTRAAFQLFSYHISQFPVKCFAHKLTTSISVEWQSNYRQNSMDNVSSNFTDVKVTLFLYTSLKSKACVLSVLSHTYWTYKSMYVKFGKYMFWNHGVFLVWLKWSPIHKIHGYSVFVHYNQMSECNSQFRLPYSDSNQMNAFTSQFRYRNVNKVVLWRKITHRKGFPFINIEQLLCT